MLLVGRSSMERTHYDILSVKEDARYEEIRTSYRSALLISHPDKLQGITNMSDAHQLEERFLTIQKAWEILGDSSSRAFYDRGLRNLRQDLETVEDDICLEEMTVEDVGEVTEIFYHCRCGDYFAIDSTELKDMGYLFERCGDNVLLQRPDTMPTSIIIPCGSCSLKIRLTIQTQ
ncbi:hypothetical protein GIB67_023450 [Kingdonia uniflora]|uniref:DPH4 homolog n=1 Tax=Kingdonia uniflora TaxID=39325 RepID=A0A7J7P9S4_9MAGN|nr:hypothetical protein GIB67_023450 [Kingdonia uniflora]